MDAYFDKDSGHKWYIPIGDKVGKQSTRPAEALEAEQARIATASGMKMYAAGKNTTTHVEELNA